LSWLCCEPKNKQEVGDVRLRYSAGSRTSQVTFEQGHDSRGDNSVLQARHESWLVRLHSGRLSESGTYRCCRTCREEQSSGQMEVQPLHRCFSRSRDRKSLGRKRYDRPPLAVSEI